MSHRRGRNNRSKSGGEGNRKGPQIAGSNSPNMSATLGNTITPPRNKELPASSVNKDKLSSETTPIHPTPEVQVTFVSKEGNTPSKQTPPSKPQEKSTTSQTEKGQINKDAIAAASAKDSAPQASAEDPAPQQTTPQGNLNDSITHITKDSHHQKSDEPMAEPPWQSVLLELKNLGGRMDAMGARMDKLDKIAETTESLNNQMLSIAQRTSALENKVDMNMTNIKALFDKIESLQKTVQDQGKTIASLKNLKENLDKTTQKTVREMNNLIDIQRQQVDTFHNTTAWFKKEIYKDVDEKILKLSQDVSFNALRDQAYYNRHNLVITGLPEDKSKNPRNQVIDFLTNTLRITNFDIDVAFRLGAPPPEGSKYARPIVIRFPRLSDRNKVWKKRMPITQDEGAPKTRIQADLPKKLREDVQVLCRVAQAASKHQEYQSAKVKNYALNMNGREYSPRELELLPYAIRPSTLATPQSETAIAFFSKYSKLSNHYPAEFVIRKKKYHSVEHFLAFRKAKLSGQTPLIQRASRCRDAGEAKAVLNLLKQDNEEEWGKEVEGFLLEALRAKFTQNDHLRAYLCDTQQREIGEASKDSRWGIGMTLQDDDVLNTTKWSTSGNLLGRTLSARKFLSQEIQGNQEASNSGTDSE